MYERKAIKSLVDNIHSHNLTPSGDFEDAKGL